MVTARDFLALLFGKPELAGMRLCIWEKAHKSSRFFDANDAASAADYATAKASTSDVYFGVCPYATEPATGRGSEDIAGAMVGLWLDVDVHHPDAHKADNLPPTREAAFDLLYEMPRKPSLVISSGYGLQGWWLFERPVAITDEASRARCKQLARHWNKTAANLGKRHGWHVDDVGDLARVLRLPGTWNRKGSEPRAVEVMK